MEHKLPHGEEENIKILQTKEYLLAGFIAFALIVAGVYLDTRFKTSTNIWLNKVFPFAILEMGLAIIIALVLIRTLDGVTKKREAIATQQTIRKMNENLFHAIFGKYIPDVLFREVEKCLIESTVIRSQYDVSYHLENLSSTSIGRRLEEAGFDCKDHVLCQVSTSYKLKNIADAPSSEMLETAMELPPSDSLHEYVAINTYSINGAEQPQSLIAEKTIKRNGQKIHTINVDLSGLETVSIRTTMTLIKRNIDQEVWTSRLPSDGIRLTINAPEDFQVSATASHKERLHGPIVTATMHKWELDYGIFPFQSIVFWWFPKEIND